MRLNVIAAKTDKSQQPWYAEQGLSFTCTQCGNCCTGGPGYVWVSDVELRRLAEHLQMPVRDVIEQYCRKIDGRYSFTERLNRGNYDCVFLKEIPVDPKAANRSGDDAQVVQTRRICTIYPVRPLQCRTWPFWPEVLSSEESWQRASRRCPGMNAGRRYSLPQIEAIRDAKDWPSK